MYFFAAIYNWFKIRRDHRLGKAPRCTNCRQLTYNGYGYHDGRFECIACSRRLPADRLAILHGLYEYLKPLYPTHTCKISDNSELLLINDSVLQHRLILYPARLCILTYRHAHCDPCNEECYLDYADPNFLNQICTILNRPCSHTSAASSGA